jgi:hypothetical protein
MTVDGWSRLRLGLGATDQGWRRLATVGIEQAGARQGQMAPAASASQSAACRMRNGTLPSWIVSMHCDSSTHGPKSTARFPRLDQGCHAPLLGTRRSRSLGVVRSLTGRPRASAAP